MLDYVTSSVTHTDFLTIIGLLSVSAHRLSDCYMSTTFCFSPQAALGWVTTHPQIKVDNLIYDY